MLFRLHFLLYCICFSYNQFLFSFLHFILCRMCVCHMFNKVLTYLLTYCHVFTALLGMQTRSSDENSVCPSVRPSVCLSNAWSLTKWKKDRSRFFIPYERSFSLVFWEEEWLVGATPCTWNFWSTGPRWSKFADFQPIFARSSSAVTSSEKSSINANRKSTTRFPMSLRWLSYVAPKSPKESLKNAKRPIAA